MIVNGTPGTNRLGVYVESICRALDEGKTPQTEDFRQLMTQMQTAIEAALPGGLWPVPGGSKAVNAASPSLQASKFISAWWSGFVISAPFPPPIPS